MPVGSENEQFVNLLSTSASAFRYPKINGYSLDDKLIQLNAQNTRDYTVLPRVLSTGATVTVWARAYGHVHKICCGLYIEMTEMVVHPVLSSGEASHRSRLE